MLVVLTQAALLGLFGYAAFLRERDGVFWLHPFFMVLAFAFQNVAALVMKQKSRSRLLHVAAASCATVCSAVGGYIIFDVKGGTGVPLSQHLNTWHGLIAAAAASVSVAHALFACLFLWPGFGFAGSMRRGTRVAVHRLTARLLLLLYGASLLIGLWKVGMTPATLSGAAGFALVLSTGLRTLFVI